jgi:hypothetical protein
MSVFPDAMPQEAAKKESSFFYKKAITFFGVDWHHCRTTRNDPCPSVMKPTWRVSES